VPEAGSSPLVGLNGSFSFTISVNAGYTGSPSAVKANGNVLTAVGGVYTISNIDRDQTVTVDGITETFSVSLPSGIGYAVSSTQSLQVGPGGSFTFHLTVGPGYTDPVVRVNGVVLPPATVGGNEYVIGNINENKTVTVTVSPIYTIELISGANGSATPSGPVSVTHGQSRTFTFTADQGYRISDVLVDGVSVGAGTVYTFVNVDADHTIEVRFTADTATDPQPDDGNTALLIAAAAAAVIAVCILGYLFVIRK
jgi:hypothetical protein